MELTKTFQKISEKAIGNAGYGNYVFRLYGRYVEQSSENNTTKVEFQLRHYTPQGYITYYSSSQKFTGELTNSSSNATNKRCEAGETTLLTATKEITHEEDGSKSINIGATFTNSYFGNTVTINQVSVDLPKINRLTTVVLNNGEYFYIDKDEYEPNPIPVTLNKYVDSYTTNLKLYYETSSDEGTPRYTIGERTNFNSTTLSFTAVELKNIYDAFPNTFFTRIICVVESYENGTKIGETEYISVGLISRDDAQPEFSDFEYKDINTVTTNLTKDPQVLIKGYSQIEMTISSTNQAKGQKGSNITTYTFANGTQTEDVTDISYPLVFSKFKAQNEVLKITAIDSRLETTTVEKNLTGKWIEYKDIEKLPFTAERKNGGTSSQVTLKLEGKIWDGNFSSTVANGIKSAIYKYKKTTDDEWTDGTTTLNVVKNGSSYSLEQDIAGDLGATGFDQEESYDIYVEISDQLSTISDTFTLGAGSPGIARYKNCVALGAPYDESLGGRVQIPKVTGTTNFETNLLKQGKDVATLDDIQKHIITVGYVGSDHQTVSSNTLTKLKLDTISCVVGNRLTLDTTNYGVKIGAGVSKIMASGFLTFGNFTAQTNTMAQVVRYRGTTKTVLSQIYYFKTSAQGGNYHGITMPMTMIDVEENDLICLEGISASSGCIFVRRTTNMYNGLTVEVIE